MRIAVIGSGAREHALSWALGKAKDCQVFVLPGNAGCAFSVPISVDDFVGIENFCKTHSIDLVIPGQEVSLALGIKNWLSMSGWRVFGPSKEASKLESSKIWAKQFMRRHGVKTANFVIAHSLDDALHAAYEFHGDCVIKWDGLAAGKGVCVCRDQSDVLLALQELAKFSSTDFVIERRLHGRELSLFAITNGEQYILLAPAKDYKRAFDQDEGPNTGGMGAVSSDSLLDDALKTRIEEEIITKTLAGLKKENISYMGFLYFGIMICEDAPYLLEYNVRLGDPETTAVLARLETSLLDLIMACLDHTLNNVVLKTKPESCVNVVLASEGYPGGYKTGFFVKGLEEFDHHALVFHAGTRLADGKIVTSGGRILNCAALGATIREAHSQAYEMIAKLHVDSSFYRRDIGEDCFEEENRNPNLGQGQQHASHY